MRKCLCVRLQKHPDFKILFQSIRKWIEICQHPHIIVDVVAQRAIRLLFGTVRFIFSIHSKRGGVGQCGFIHDQNAIAFFQFLSVSCLQHILYQNASQFSNFSCGCSIAWSVKIYEINLSTNTTKLTIGLSFAHFYLLNVRIELAGSYQNAPERIVAYRRTSAMQHNFTCQTFVYILFWIQQWSI